MATDDALWRRLTALSQRHPHYPPAAFLFVQRAVVFTHRRVARAKHPAGSRHVTGPELLDGIRRLALEEFGPFARLVFNDWGITATRDFGRLVFLMVEAGVLGASKHDALADFDDGYDFATAFEQPFQPTGSAAPLPCLDRP